jgi:hypothetical protein
MMVSRWCRRRRSSREMRARVLVVHGTEL